MVMKKNRNGISLLAIASFLLFVPFVTQAQIKIINSSVSTPSNTTYTQPLVIECPTDARLTQLTIPVDTSSGSGDFNMWYGVNSTTSTTSLATRNVSAVSNYLYSTAFSATGLNLDCNDINYIGFTKLNGDALQFRHLSAGFGTTTPDIALLTSTGNQVASAFTLDIPQGDTTELSVDLSPLVDSVNQGNEKISVTISVIAFAMMFVGLLVALIMFKRK